MTDFRKSPNPQGKGLVPVLENLQLATKNLSVPAKDIHRVTNELFTSLFILNSQIRFKPVCGQSYWLYRKNNEYRLSLISPEQWSPVQSGKYIGHCQLHCDLTWTLELSDACRNDKELLAEIARQRQYFDKSVRQADTIDQILPVYDNNLPFYSRILAHALSYSLRLSMQKSGISGMNLKEAEKLKTISKRSHID